ncbi:MAG: enoyl-CoA hydratase/isomerase family protein [Pseudomonadota bacterium]
MQKKLPEFEGLQTTLNGAVAEVELRRAPHNFFDAQLIGDLAGTFEHLSQRDDCRAIVLAADGESFCAGADFGDPNELDSDGNAPDAPDRDELAELYEQAARLFDCAKPVIAAVHGAAIGGGFGLAVMADFRVTCSEARFSANFSRLGIHPGFGLTVTLPRLVGPQKAGLIFATSRRWKGCEAFELGLADVLVAKDQVRTAAHKLADEIASNAPLSVQATRAVLRGDLASSVRRATPSELQIQTELRKTDDFREGIAAAKERRTPEFRGS